MAEIITYTAVGDAPADMRAAASMVAAGPGTHWVCTGPTPEAAEAKLRAFIASQAAKYGGEGKKPPRKPKEAPVADEIGEVI